MAAGRRCLSAHLAPVTGATVAPHKLLALQAQPHAESHYQQPQGHRQRERLGAEHPAGLARLNGWQGYNRPGTCSISKQGMILSVYCCVAYKVHPIFVIDLCWELLLLCHAHGSPYAAMPCCSRAPQHKHQSSVFICDRRTCLPTFHLTMRRPGKRPPHVPQQLQVGVVGQQLRCHRLAALAVQVVAVQQVGHQLAGP